MDKTLRTTLLRFAAFGLCFFLAQKYFREVRGWLFEKEGVAGRRK